MKPRDIPRTTVFYMADDAYAPSNTPWVPCIHMPRWASRLTLTVTATKIERLQAISADDAIAEGIALADHKCGCERCSTTSQLCPATQSSLIMAFADLWRTLHGPESWDANPQIVALTFTVARRNIDAKDAA